MAATLGQLEGERKAMIADIAHELRNPLATLQLRIDALSDGLVAFSEEEARLLQGQVGLLARLIGDLRTLSLADADKLSLNRLELNLNDLAGAVVRQAHAEQTLTFTYGEDSEATFAESFAEARANASYITANVGEQTQTLELLNDDENRWGGLRGASLPRGLSEGGTVEAIFYDGDPAGDAQTLETLTFTYAQDSEAGFAADFADAAETAAYVTVTTSPQTYTVDLSAIAEGRDFRQHRGGHRR